MASPQRVRIDKQGRIVVPQNLREELIDGPGELLIEQTPDGLLLRPATAPGRLRTADDGLPVLDLDHDVTNDEVLAAINRERDER